MQKMLAVTIAAALALPVAREASEITIVDFKGTDPATTHTWHAMNDPVMGGQSYSTVTVENSVLNFTGLCAIVPSLQAPGFITAVNSDSKPFSDVSSCEGLKITAQSFNDYSGFRVSFGNAHPKGGKFFAYGYKANFQPTVGLVGSVMVPFHNFTDFWDDSTGGEPRAPPARVPPHTRYAADAFDRLPRRPHPHLRRRARVLPGRQDTDGHEDDVHLGRGQGGRSPPRGRLGQRLRLHRQGRRELKLAPARLPPSASRRATAEQSDAGD